MDPTALPRDLVADALERQMRTGLAMLRDAVARCSDALWLDATPTNACWQIAYHALYFTDLYLRPDEAAFVPFPGHQADVQRPDGIGGPGDPADRRPVVPVPYGRAHVLAYADHLMATMGDAIGALDLASPSSGFPWYPGVGKLAHQFVNLRHLQHHAAQLADRLRAATDQGVGWVVSRPAPSRTS
ncbi:MAG: hypothetical protein P1P87_07285 [Trueperaceae bacterium]|nr:hypothetical protein [Trueperaceae bacterium]